MWDVQLDKIIRGISGDWVQYWDNRLNEFIHLIDKSKTTQYLSFGVYNVLGYTPEELLGKKAFQIMDQHTNETAHRYFDDFLQTMGTMEYQYQSWKKNGEKIMLYARANVVVYQGKPLGMINIIQPLERAKEYPNVSEAYFQLLHKMMKGEPLYD